MPLIQRYLVVAAVLFAISHVAFGQANSPQYEKWITTYSGGNALILTVDRENRIYIAGLGLAAVPVTPNAFASTSAVPDEAQGYLLQLDASGAKILYATYLNGISPVRIAVDPDGFMYVLGYHIEPGLFTYTYNSPAPITSNAAQTTPGVVSTPVLVKISPTGELVYGTYLGGLTAIVGGLAVDSRGAATVCGSTSDPDLPVSANAFQPHPEGQVDAFITRVSPDGSRFEALTYLGGSGADFCYGAQLDQSGNVYVYGDTDSRFFPVTRDPYQRSAKGKQNLFLAKFDRDLTSLNWSTYIGSSGTDFSQSLVLNNDGSLSITGTTYSGDFPVSAGAAPSYVEAPILPTSLFEVVSRPSIAVVDSSGSQLRASYVFPFWGDWLGTSDQGGLFYGQLTAYVSAIAENSTLNAEGVIALKQQVEPFYPFPILVRFDPALDRPTYLGPLLNIAGANSPNPGGVGLNSLGDVIISGRPMPTYDLPGVPYRKLGGYPASVVFSMNFSSETTPLVTQVLNHASLAASATAPEQLMAIRGLGFGSLKDTVVLLDGVPASLLSVASDKIVALAPSSFGAKGTVSIVVRSKNATSESREIPVVAVNPAIFTSLAGGAGQALASNPANTPNSPTQPAQRGARLRLLVTGLGATDSLRQPLATVTVEVAGLNANVLSISPSDGEPQGSYAIDILVPIGSPASDFVPVKIKAGGVASQAGVTVALR